MNPPQHLNSPSSSTYDGPNYCPNCRCDIRAVALALEYAANMDNRRSVPATFPKRTVDVTYRSPAGLLENGNGNGYTSRVAAPSRTVITPDLIAKVTKMRAEKISVRVIADRLGLKMSTANGIVYRKDLKERMARMNDVAVTPPAAPTVSPAPVAKNAKKPAKKHS